MNVRQWFLLFLMATWAVEALGSIALIGTERKPRTKSEAVAVVILAAVLIALALTVAW